MFWAGYSGMVFLPSTVAPIGLSDGLPVGVQIVGRRGDDARTLAGAAVIENRLAASIGQYIRNTDG